MITEKEAFVEDIKRRNSKETIDAFLNKQKYVKGNEQDMNVNYDFTNDTPKNFVGLTEEPIIKRLLKANEIEIRVGSVKEKMVNFLLYTDARYYSDILNELYGVFGWRSSFERKGEPLFCKISVFDKKTNQWISKEDCGIESQQTDDNKYKAERDSAFKRACYQWRIGDELYTMKNMILSCKGLTKKRKNGKYELKKKYNDLAVVDVSYDGNKEIEKVVCENSYKKITFFKNKKAVIEKKTRHNKYIIFIIKKIGIMKKLINQVVKKT